MARPRKPRAAADRSAAQLRHARRRRPAASSWARPARAPAAFMLDAADDARRADRRHDRRSALTAVAAESVLLAILWLIGFFVLRNGWFIAVRDGRARRDAGQAASSACASSRATASRLTGGAVIARNAMREIEILPAVCPSSRRSGQPGHRQDDFLALRAGVERHLPVLPAVQPRPAARRRPARGHLGGAARARRSSATDIVASLAQSDRPRRTFSDAALEPLRRIRTADAGGSAARRPTTTRSSPSPRRSGARPDLPDDGDDYGFLSDYYAALCARLERGMMVGLRRADKYSRSDARPRGLAVPLPPANRARSGWSSPSRRSSATLPCPSNRTGSSSAGSGCRAPWRSRASGSR